MNKRNIRPDTSDVDSPAWTAKDLAQARPASEVLPQLLGDVRAAALLAPRGRPKSEVTNVRVGMRLSPQVVEHFKAGSSGWQTRIDQVLREFVAQKTAHRWPNLQRCRPCSRFVWRSSRASRDCAAPSTRRASCPLRGQSLLAISEGASPKEAPPRAARWQRLLQPAASARAASPSSASLPASIRRRRHKPRKADGR